MRDLGEISVFRIILSFFILFSLFLVGLYEHIVADLPAPDSLIKRAGGESTKIYDREGRLLYEILDPLSGARTRVPLDEIPIYLQQATIATEDKDFYSNPGVDPKAMLRALYQNVRRGRVVSGASTITQQLARMILLSPKERFSRSIIRKLREIILAYRLSKAYSKEKILEMYLNEVYYGNLAYGVEAAAQVYFGVHARDLDLAQCSLLAGLPQAPAKYNPLVDFSSAKERQKLVLELMVRQGYITEEEALLAYEEPLHLAGGFDMLAPHFVTYVINLLEEKYGGEITKGGWQITTTLDLDLQRRAEEIIRRHISRLKEHKAKNAALVAINPKTGEILAMVGSADYFDEEIDGAVNVAISPRQPGSAMKPFLYAAAFEMGWTPADVVYDVRTVFVGEEEAYVPKNYDNLYHGPVTLRDALANSYNLPAVILQKKIGKEALLDMAHRLGITTLRHERRYGLSLTLGGGEVKLLEMVAAYAAFANGGRRVEPVAIKEVVREKRRVSSPLAPHSSRFTLHDSTLTPQVAYLITNILSDNEARRPSFGERSPLRLSRPAAAKTGTTTDWRDNWTIGYTPHLVCGVWVGNSDGSPMRHVSGITGAGPIWHDFMEEALEQKPGDEFPLPSGMVWRDICTISGLLVNPDCPSRRREVFIAGTEPKETCDQHLRVEVDKRTGKKALPETPMDYLEERVFWLPPPELRDWAREKGIPLLETDSPPYTPSIALISPEPKSVLVIDPHLPLDYQRIEVKALAYDEWRVERVELYVNDEILAVLTEPPYRTLWQLREGEHTFYALAISSDGRKERSQDVKVIVKSH